MNTQMAGSGTGGVSSYPLRLVPYNRTRMEAYAAKHRLSLNAAINAAIADFLRREENR